MTATAHHTTAESTRAAILDMERSPWTGRLRLRDCIELYGNEDAVGGDYAFKAFCEGRSAFWSTCRGNNQVALCLRDSANLMSTLENALTTIPAHRQHWMADYLATLVPLNHRAAHELSEAYARIGEWRDVEELEVRRLRDLGRAA